MIITQLAIFFNWKVIFIGENRTTCSNAFHNVFVLKLNYFLIQFIRYNLEQIISYGFCSDLHVFIFFFRQQYTNFVFRIVYILFYYFCMHIELSLKIIYHLILDKIITQYYAWTLFYWQISNDYTEHWNTLNILLYNRFTYLNFINIIRSNISNVQAVNINFIKTYLD